MIWRVEIKDKESVFDAAGESILKDIEDLGIRSVENVNVEQIFLINSQASAAQIQKICKQLLVDPIVQDYTCSQKAAPTRVKSKNIKVIEIAYNPGVMDPVEESTLKGIRDLGIANVTSVRTAKKYLLHGKPTPKELNIIVSRVLSNKLIQHVVQPDAKKAKKVSSSLKIDLFFINSSIENKRS